MRTATETLGAYERYLAPAGVTRMANITGLDYVGVPVFCAIRPNSRSLSVAIGKGLDPQSARAAAMMEALEMWHAETIALPTRQATFRELARSEHAIDPTAMRATRRTPVTDDTVIDWVLGRDLLADRSVWVPRGLCSLDAVARPGVPLLPTTSNGLASGNSDVEATVHALCELIERDACSLWFGREEEDGGKSAQLDLSEVADPAIAGLLGRITGAGLAVAAFDVTSDIGVPSYACLVVDPPGGFRAMGYFWGFGCHLDPQVALVRAVVEAVQVRLTEISGIRDDIGREAYASNRDDAELASLRDALADPRPGRRLSERGSLASGDLSRDLDVILSSLRRCAIGSAVVVDLRKPEIGIPVVKVFAPELEGVPFQTLPGPRASRQASAPEP